MPNRATRVYVYNFEHIREREETNASVQSLVERAGVEIANNLAMPVQIEDLNGNIMLSNKELTRLAWEYIDKQLVK